MKEKDAPVVIYHRVYASEDFNTAANTIWNLVVRTQKIQPGKPRCLYLDIDGHKNEVGGFDHDMVELQHFILEQLSPYLTSFTVPLFRGEVVENKRPQLNEVPHLLIANTLPSQPGLN